MFNIIQACVKATVSLGYSSSKKEQQEVILSFVQGKDVFAVWPMGFGKSLCYTYSSRVFDTVNVSSGSIVVIITQLTAIIKDQVSIRP